MSETTLTAKAETEFSFSQGFVLAIIANILWGTSFLASKYTLQAWGPFTSAALRFGIATVCLLIILKAMKKKIDMPETMSHWIGLILIATSAFGVLYPMQLAGLKFIPSSLSAAIDLPDLTGPVSMLNWAIDTEVYHAKETSFTRRNHPAHPHA